ncbi:TetR/AcrR family transcriptional regulator [Mycolicibacterium arseniciresistens]|uniref:TetR/AcrR family transcriptional regulator n=1 Tax=Mycolicibacterium arseniciresistens TaxID=3062257 RepID=A0ABT8UPD3_9MYCO|nr:TetR/AcrR family transcriptional regulator [Mycolicibacterium arseniciresistens]MDO3639651.1 TetR/AcrR family transcriptional regulator [Mycolicibacterium arseniciresistens]
MPTGRIARMPAARRRRLVQVAAVEFAESGYSGTSLNRIIADCGMGKSSFYYLFASKSELFEFVTTELIAEAASRWTVPDPAGFSGTQFWPRVADVFAEFLRVSEEHEAFLLLARLFYSDAPGSAKTTVGGALAAVEDWVRRALAEGRRCGAVRDDLPEDLQYRLTVGALRLFDEWTVAQHDRFSADGLRRLTDAQFATLRRMLAD